MIAARSPLDLVVSPVVHPRPRLVVLENGTVDFPVAHLRTIEASTSGHSRRETQVVGGIGSRDCIDLDGILSPLLELRYLHFQPLHLSCEIVHVVGGGNWGGGYYRVDAGVVRTKEG